MSIYRATLRGAVLSGVALGALSVANSAAWAQQTPAPAPETTAAPQDQPASSADIIIVTGSRLRQESFDSPNPVLTVGVQDIENKQVANAVDVIEDIPLLGIGSNNRGTQTQNGDSFAFPDILDLGTQRTLTLLNGRRVVATNPGSVFVPGNASGSQVDLSVFSPAMIERVEVLAGTGGAVYGADAVGGVVNLITRDDFNGLTLNLQGGMTEIGDGEQIKFGAIYGTDLFDGRGHIMVTADYFHQEIMGATPDSNARYGGSGITNAFDGGRRNTFSAAAAADALRAGGASTAIPAALAPFRTTGTDGVQSIYFGPLSLQNPMITSGGTLLTGQTFGGGFANTTNLVPATTVHPTLARAGANGITFFAPNALPTGANSAVIISTLAPGTNVSGLSAGQLDALALAVLQANRPTPYEYYQANPTLNPLLFAGTFGTTRADTGATNFNNGAYTTIPNTSAATNAIFPRIAQPYMFAANGNLVPVNIGSISPQGRLGQTFGGSGYDSFALGHTQFQAGTDRIALASVADYDFNDNLRWNSQWMYTYAEFAQTQAAVAHSAGGSPQGGTVAIPVYVDQNPYINAQALGVINGLGAPGQQPIGTIAGQGGARVMYLGRALDDLLGGGQKSTLEVQNFQITNVLEGEFSVLGREVYWDVAAGYGRSNQITERPDFLDIEFALAVDVVQTPNGPRCRQQTLAAPESVLLRNPGLASSVIPSGFVPTAAQVAACQPLNLFGSGNASAAARDYVLGDANVHALNTLEYYSASAGSDVWDLPGGALSVGANIEYRKEGFEFEPSPDTQRGAGRTAPQARGEGQSMFTEYGFEAHLPIFGGDFTFPLMERLDLAYAQRIVKRETESPTVTQPISETEDDTFNYSINWSPISDLTFRAAKSRTVRSPSLVELVGPFTVAFSALTAATNPCITSQIDTGPAPATRRANCVAAAQAYNVNGGADNVTSAAEATAFLSTFAGTAATRPANAAGNPGLVNEEADTYTLGFTWQPSFVPNLTIASDFFSVDLKNEIGLFGPANFTTGCFDNPAFPNSQFGGSFACDTFLMGVPTGPGGQYVVPTTNPITGRPGSGGVLGGSVASVQLPFELAFVGFANLNAASREFRGVNTEVRYNFDLVDLPLVGGYLADAGEIYLRASHFHTQRYDTNAGVLDRLVGEHTNPEHEVRFDVRHKIGSFDHILQSYWNSRTVTSIETAKSLYPEQNASFIGEAFWFFNYSAAYQINDRFTIRGTINNLFDTQDPRGAFGVGNQYDAGVGREFIVGVTANF